ncbi:pyridoxamine 5-phosphate oxidase [uncultured Limimaricola sp.]|uniref:pyridoxamine 5'-phosphate oxidase family protein n=1 Tax=uncultured Limimaricola sp. TaxID=2211667 RepID=UPI0030F8F267
MTDPIRPTDDGARRQAARLLSQARHAVLGVRGDGPPGLSRVAVLPVGADLLLLVSELSRHTRALDADPDCALLIGEPGTGDPLAAARLSLELRAEAADKAAHREAWLAWHPGAALYYDFADFRLLRLVMRSGFLVGGFGRAFALSRADLENCRPTA